MANFFRKRFIYCPTCLERIKPTANVKYIRCPECKRLIQNTLFVEPKFEDLKLANKFNIHEIPESVYQIAFELMNEIKKHEFLGNNEIRIWHTAKVCGSQNELQLLSNLKYINAPEKVLRFNLSQPICITYEQSHTIIEQDGVPEKSSVINHKNISSNESSPICDYAYACPIRIATYLYLLKETYGLEYIKEQRKLAKKNATENNARKHFCWDVNNHSSQYIPTKTLNFIEKLLDNNYIVFSHLPFNETMVHYTVSKNILEKSIEELMKLSNKELKTLALTDFISDVTPMSLLDDSLISQAKYVEYLRRNGTYQQFYKKQQKTEKMMKKEKKN
jgi:hypothetical protein